MRSIDNLTDRGKLMEREGKDGYFQMDKCLRERIRFERIRRVVGIDPTLGYGLTL